jgi:hypothetical protein
VAKNKKKARWDSAQVEALVSGGGDATARAWLDGQGDLDGDASLVLSAIEAAVKLQAVAPLQALDAGPHKKLGRKALHRLRTAGVEVEAPRAQTSFSLARERITVEPVAYVGPPDPDGYSEFMLAYTDEEGTCAVMGWFGGPRGIRNTSHGHLTRTGLRELSRDLQAAPHLVRLPFIEALAHILPAAAQAEAVEGHPPHDWEHFVTHVPQATLTASLTHDAARSRAEAVDAEQLKGSSHLASNPWFQLWPVAPEAMEQVVTQLAAKMDEPDGEDGEPADMMSELSAAAETALSGMREEWARRARLAATACDALGDSDGATTAAMIALAIEADMPASELPLVERTLQMQIGWMAQQQMQEQMKQQLEGLAPAE